MKARTYVTLFACDAHTLQKSINEMAVKGWRLVSAYYANSVHFGWMESPNAD